MAANKSFLKEAVLNFKPQPGGVKVVKHVAGPLEDGSLVREVADHSVYIKAIFTQQCQDNYREQYELGNSMDDSPPEWDHGLLHLNQYDVEFQSSTHPANTDREARFVLVIKKFGLENTHRGFYSKRIPLDIMDDRDVQRKAAIMNEIQTQASVRDCATEENQDSHVSLSLLVDQLGESTLPDAAEETQDSSVSFSVLVDQLGESTHPSTAEETQDSSISFSVLVGQLGESSHQETQASQSQGSQQGGAAAAVASQVGARYTLQEALAAMRVINVKDFIISPDQQAVLDAIPEWKADYEVPATESQASEMHSSASGSLPPDLLHQGATLRSEEGPAPAFTLPKHPAPVTSATGSSQGSGRSLSRGGKRATPVEGETRSSHSIGSEESLPHQPDMSLSISSPSTGEEDSSVENARNGSLGASGKRLRMNEPRPEVDGGTSRNVRSRGTADERSVQISGADAGVRSPVKTTARRSDRTAESENQSERNRTGVSPVKTTAKHSDHTAVSQTHPKRNRTGVSQEMAPDSCRPQTQEFDADDLNTSQGFRPSALSTQDLLQDHLCSESSSTHPGNAEGTSLRRNQRQPGGMTPRAMQSRRTGEASSRESAAPGGEAAFNSTQGDGDEGQSPVLLLTLSPIERRKSISAMEREEDRRLAALGRDITDSDELPQTTKGSRAANTGALEHSIERITDSSVTLSPEEVAAHSQTSRGIQGTAHTVLVDYSGSDETGNEDGMASQKASGTGSVRERRREELVSSGETVMVPDSSQEDIIVLSSSGGSSGIGKPAQSVRNKQAENAGNMQEEEGARNKQVESERNKQAERVVNKHAESPRSSNKQAESVVNKQAESPRGRNKQAESAVNKQAESSRSKNQQAESPRSRNKKTDSVSNKQAESSRNKETDNAWNKQADSSISRNKQAESSRNKQVDNFADSAQEKNKQTEADALEELMHLGETRRKAKRGESPSVSGVTETVSKQNRVEVSLQQEGTHTCSHRDQIVTVTVEKATFSSSPWLRSRQPSATQQQSKKLTAQLSPGSLSRSQKRSNEREVIHASGDKGLAANVETGTHTSGRQTSKTDSEVSRSMFPPDNLSAEEPVRTRSRTVLSRQTPPKKQTSANLAAGIGKKRLLQAKASAREGTSSSLDSSDAEETVSKRSRLRQQRTRGRSTSKTSASLDTVRTSKQPRPRNDPAKRKNNVREVDADTSRDSETSDGHPSSHFQQELPVSGSAARKNNLRAVNADTSRDSETSDGHSRSHFQQELPVSGSAARKNNLRALNADTSRDGLASGGHLQSDFQQETPASGFAAGTQNTTFPDSSSSSQASQASSSSGESSPTQHRQSSDVDIEGEGTSGVLQSVQSTIQAYLKRRARDPRQRRLRRFQLTGMLLTKVEECLARPMELT